ncbi:MAG: cell division protein FtsQ/DivIB [Acidobacteria bacterium]|nr:cell division protein FtsQ/DivIB [Acidobacteriota bacterium]
MTVHTQTDKHFRRSKHPTRRPRRMVRRWWRVARGAGLAMGVAFGVYHAAVLLLAAPFLMIDEVVVHGEDQLSEGEVLALVSALRGENILTVDLERHRLRLLASPWLRDGALKRILPSTIEVQVTERRPAAVARLEHRLYLVDEHGTVIDEYGPSFSRFDLPIIEGLALSGAGRPTVDPARMGLVSRVLAQLSQHADVLDSISEIDVSDPYNAVVLLNDDPALLYLGRDHFLERLQSYVELGPTLRERVPSIDYFDLRFDRRVYVGPADSTTRSSRRSIEPTVQEPAVN